MQFHKLFERSARNPWVIFPLIRHFPKFIKLHVRLLADKRVPLYLKALFWLALIYVLYPFDLLPDWVMPLIGNLDDLFILIMASRYFLKNVPREVLREHVQKIEAGE